LHNLFYILFMNNGRTHILDYSLSIETNVRLECRQYKMDTA
jgi:hypothetical protein